MDRRVRRFTLTFDIAFGKDAEDEPDETPVGADSITERRPSEDHAQPSIGFGHATPWENQ